MATVAVPNAGLMGLAAGLPAMGRNLLQGAELERRAKRDAFQELLDSVRLQDLTETMAARRALPENLASLAGALQGTPDQFVPGPATPPEQVDPAAVNAQGTLPAGSLVRGLPAARTTAEVLQRAPAAVAGLQRAGMNPLALMGDIEARAQLKREREHKEEAQRLAETALATYQDKLRTGKSTKTDQADFVASMARVEQLMGRHANFDLLIKQGQEDIEKGAYDRDNANPQLVEALTRIQKGLTPLEQIDVGVSISTLAESKGYQLIGQKMRDAALSKIAERDPDVAMAWKSYANQVDAGVEPVQAWDHALSLFPGAAAKSITAPSAVQLALKGKDAEALRLGQELMGKRMDLIEAQTSFKEKQTQLLGQPTPADARKDRQELETRRQHLLTQLNFLLTKETGITRQERKDRVAALRAEVRAIDERLKSVPGPLGTALQAAPAAPTPTIPVRPITAARRQAILAVAQRLFPGKDPSTLNEQEQRRVLDELDKGAGPR